MLNNIADYYNDKDYGNIVGNSCTNFKRTISLTLVWCPA